MKNLVNIIKDNPNCLVVFEKRRLIAKEGIGSTYINWEGQENN